jgi:type II secretory ATPase GspE/PulE/Tfp pilus assembly ATPase PilB-like protein
VGEIRDEETAEIALRGAQTGHLLLATVHSDNGAAALVRLLDLGVSALLLSSGLSLIVSQRLLRCLCPHCKEPAALSDTQIAQFDKKGIDRRGILVAGQCKHCDQTGYHGRTAIYDLLAIDQEMKMRMAKDRSFLAYLKEEGTRRGRANLRKEGLKKVVAGLTSLEELKRVVG